MLWILVLASILSEAAWWQTSGRIQDRLLVAAVTTAFAAAIGHSLITRRAAWTSGLLIVGGGVWFLAGWLNQNVDLPYGHVRYSGRLGPQLVGVPLWLLLAWITAIYVALLAARRTAHATLLVAVLAGCYLAATDAALQAALRHFGYTTWSHAHPGIPGIPGIPAQDVVGVLLVAVVTLLLLDLLPANDARDALPRVLFAWRYLAEVVGAQVVLHQPVLTLSVAIGGGVLAVPYAYLTFVDRV